MRWPKAYVAPDSTVPAPPKRDGGYIIRYTIERVAGIDAWAAGGD